MRVRVRARGCGLLPTSVHHMHHRPPWDERTRRSGKTFSMMGDESNPGIIPLMNGDLFR